LATASRAVETLADTHGLVTRAGTQIWASSEGRGWRSVFATAQHEEPFEGDFRAVADHLIVIHLSGPARVCRTLAGKQESCLIPPGGVFIMPGGVDFGVRLEAELDTLHFYLHRSIVDEIAEEYTASQDRIEIIPRLGKLDPLLEQIALGLREQLNDASLATALYVDHLARAAAAHLVRAHSTAGPALPIPTRKSGLSARQLQRATDYIHCNIERDPTLAELAAAAGLSPVYFARQFKLATGMAPHRYLLRARVEHAKRLLLASDLPIAAIALDCGFCHQEHLTRVFRKHCGTTPAAYRRLVRS
jgi:AraC family transcriptional regulator